MGTLQSTRGKDIGSKKMDETESDASVQGVKEVSYPKRPRPFITAYRSTGYEDPSLRETPKAMGLVKLADRDS